jgi:hypothetical protein
MNNQNKSFSKQMAQKQFCFINSESCAGEIIKAHSISQQHLKRFSPENGKAWTISHNDFKQEGIKNEASTFRGFCGHHDKELFKCFEDSPYDYNNPEHVFKLTLRTIAKEFFLKFNAIQTISSLPHNKLELFYLGSCLSFHRLLLWREYLIERLRKKDWSYIQSVSVKIKSLSCFASSVFYVTNDYGGEVLNDLRKFSDSDLDPVILNLVPVDDSTIVTLAYRKNNKMAKSKLVEALRANISETSQNIEELITRLLILYVENFYFSNESYLQNIAPRKDTILKAFNNHWDDSIDLNSSSLKDINFFKKSSNA